MLESSAQIQQAVHTTLVFEREIPARIADVFAAYADAKVRAAWSAPSNDIIVYDHEEFREGGQDRFRCGPMADPNIHGTTNYWEIVPNRRIVSSETLTMDGTRLAVALNTLEFTELENATMLKITVQLVSFIGPEMMNGYKDGNDAALNGLVNYFHRRNS